MDCGKILFQLCQGVQEDLLLAGLAATSRPLVDRVTAAQLANEELRQERSAPSTPVSQPSTPTQARARGAVAMGARPIAAAMAGPMPVTVSPTRTPTAQGGGSGRLPTSAAKSQQGALPTPAAMSPQGGQGPSTPREAVPFVFTGAMQPQQRAPMTPHPEEMDWDLIKDKTPEQGKEEL